MKAQLAAWFEAQGYVLDSAPLPEGVDAEFCARRTSGIVREFAFVFHGLEGEAFQSSATLARRWANRQFRLPKMMRIRVPRTLCVLVCEHVDGQLKRYVDTTMSRTGWGGEVFHLLVVDTKQQKVHHQPGAGAVGQAERRIYQHPEFGQALLRHLSVS